MVHAINIYIGKAERICHVILKALRVNGCMHCDLDYLRHCYTHLLKV